MMHTLELRSVTLRVRDLTRSVTFYRQIGFVSVGDLEHGAALATENGAAPILFLHEDQAATPPADDAAGLFHAALLLPNRAALGSWLQMAGAARVEFDGFSDHGVSEALYLRDPEGNGLEIYADRPREAWPHRGNEVAMVTDPLRMDELLRAARQYSGPPLSGARWGHLHLRVTDLERSTAHYRRALGVEVTQSTYPGAMFLAADGYHHHLGLNTWGDPRTPRSEISTGLDRAVFAQRSATAPAGIKDPDGITVDVVPWLQA